MTIAMRRLLRHRRRCRPRRMSCLALGRNRTRLRKHVRPAPRPGQKAKGRVCALATAIRLQLVRKDPRKPRVPIRLAATAFSR